MKCSKCGAEIREGSLYCDVCGTEVRIVPDYSPLDEVLTAHVRGEIKGRVDKERPDTEPEVKPKKKKKSSPRKNKKKKMIWILGSLLAVMIVGLILFRSSYAGLIQRGNNAMSEKRYNAAYRYFHDASEKKPERPQAYTGMAKVYIAQENMADAENLFLTEIDEQPDNAEIYRAAAEFYLDTKQASRIPIMLDNCTSETVIAEMSDYYVEGPTFSLADGKYEEVQSLVLSSEEGNQIYYTLDESEPTKENGTRYGTEIELDEKEWVVKAICVNKKGIPSLVETRHIQVELLLSDPPMVAPSSGLYEEHTNITIQVPEGFTAYYVFGSTEPTKENWTKYEGPISMPEGNKIFSAVLMENDTGKISAATVRNYDLKISVQEESTENIEVEEGQD